MTKLFKIRKDECWLAVGALLVFVLLNALLIYRYYDRFTLGGNLGFWTIFYKSFHVSGFDAYSYITMSNLRVHFTTARHPLYLSLLLPFYWINHWQMQYTHYNMAVYFEAFIIVFSSVYAFLFLYRTLHELISLKRQDAVMLTVYFFSFGHVLLSTMVPDHFAISMLSCSPMVGGHSVGRCCWLSWCLWRCCGASGNGSTTPTRCRRPRQ